MADDKTTKMPEQPLSMEASALEVFYNFTMGKYF